MRKHSSTAYVVFSNRLGTSDPKEFFNVANDLTRSVIDVHYYSLFEDFFKTLNAQQNIDFIYSGRQSDLNSVTASNGPLVFVGEWVAEWKLDGGTKEELQRFAKAQLDVFGQATFGWAYWSYKNSINHWSMEWMIKKWLYQALESC